MKINKLFRFALFMCLGLFVLALPLLAQATSNPVVATAAGKTVLIALAVASVVQAIKAGVNQFKPDLIKGRVALALSIVGTLGGYFATLDVSHLTWANLALGVFASSGVFATFKGLIAGHQS